MTFFIFVCLLVSKNFLFALAVFGWQIWTWNVECGKKVGCTNEIREVANAFFLVFLMSE